MPEFDICQFHICICKKFFYTENYCIIPTINRVDKQKSRDLMIESVLGNPCWCSGSFGRVILAGLHGKDSCLGYLRTEVAQKV